MSVQRDIVTVFATWAKEVGLLDGDVQEVVSDFFNHASNDIEFSQYIDKSDINLVLDKKQRGQL